MTVPLPRGFAEPVEFRSGCDLIFGSRVCIGDARRAGPIPFPHCGNPNGARSDPAGGRPRACAFPSPQRNARSLRRRAMESSRVAWAEPSALAHRSGIGDASIRPRWMPAIAGMTMGMRSPWNKLWARCPPGEVRPSDFNYF